jgi:hypothetical protein
MTLSELDTVATLIRQNKSAQLDTRPHELMLKTETYLLELLEGGVCILTSERILQSDYVFLKLCDGQDFIGRQKVLYRVFFGSIREASLEPGPGFRCFAKALSSLNDCYRAAGFSPSVGERSLRLRMRESRRLGQDVYRGAV